MNTILKKPKKQKDPIDIIPEVTPTCIKQRYMVTNTIQGMINNRQIRAVRGDVILLNEQEHNVFKDFTLLIPNEE